MGGKQKRAAKLKRWSATHNAVTLQDNEGSSSGDQDNGSPSFDCQHIPYEIKRDILKRRQKKTRGYSNREKICNLFSSPENWPVWVVTFFLGMCLYVAAFYLARFLIQTFTADKPEVDRDALFSSLRQAVPTPIYKLVRIVDYLFCSKELSYQGLQKVMYAIEHTNHRAAEEKEYSFKAEYTF